jgi:hypothetical protein
VIPVFSRPVFPTEWLYLAAARSMPPLAIQLCVEGDGIEGDGHVDPEGLARAVAVASAACPGARLARRGRTWVDSGQPPPVRVVDEPTFGAGGSWNLLTGPLDQTQPLDPENGPTCEVLIAGGTIVFRAFHGVMDGRGALAWAAYVFRALRGEPPVGAPSRPIRAPPARAGRNCTSGSYGRSQTGASSPAARPSGSRTGCRSAASAGWSDESPTDRHPRHDQVVEPAAREEFPCRVVDSA